MDAPTQHPAFPVDVQLLILKQAAADLEGQRPRVWKAGLLSFCLVSREWRDAGQRLLFSRVSLSGRGAGRRVSRMLLDEPRLASLVEEVDFVHGDAGDLETNNVLGLLSKLPALKHLDRLLLTQTAFEGLQFGVAAQPRICSLSFIVYRTVPTNGRDLLRFFDLTALRSLDVDVSSPSSFSFVGLEGVAGGLTALRLANDFGDASLDAFLGRCTKLSSLTMESYDTTLVLPPNILGLFPQLRSLTMIALHVGQLPTMRHASLEVLSLWAMGSADAARPDALAVVQSVTASPSRLPSLRRLELLSVRFNSRSRPAGLWLFDVGPQLQKAGVVLVDSRGVEWKPEWEAEAGQAVLDAVLGDDTSDASDDDGDYDEEDYDEEDDDDDNDDDSGEDEDDDNLAA